MEDLADDLDDDDNIINDVIIDGGDPEVVEDLADDLDDDDNIINDVIIDGGDPESTTLGKI